MRRGIIVSTAKILEKVMTKGKKNHKAETLGAAVSLTVQPETFLQSDAQ
jgi:hypothetical protein